jgi:hypothetical protein
MQFPIMKRTRPSNSPGSFDSFRLFIMHSAVLHSPLWEEQRVHGSANFFAEMPAGSESAKTGVLAGESWLP